MSECTPTTEEIREAFASRFWDDYSVYQPTEEDLGEERANFDRWLAGVQAEAWKEGYVAGFLKAMGGELDGSAREAVRLLTGFTDAELDKLGGFEYCE